MKNILKKNEYNNNISCFQNKKIIKQFVEKFFVIKLKILNGSSNLELPLSIFNGKNI